MSRYCTFPIKAICVVQVSHSSAMNMSLHKKEHALIVKHFFCQNDSNASAALRAYLQMKNLRRGPMCVNAVKLIIRKYEATGSPCVETERG